MKNTQLKIQEKAHILLVVILFFFSPVYLFSQDIQVSGRVMDEKGEPIIGAQIIEEGKSNGTTTKTDGSFSFQVSSSRARLKVTFLGFQPTEVLLGGKTVVNVTLKEAVSDLDEVVVIGYGSTRKKDLTGSVSQVNTKELSLAPVRSFEDALAGRVAGLQVISADGQPGYGSNIVVRGANSLTQDTSPLFVIDGIPVDGFDNASINPEEIATINVLKDASATAIYGARAANGVIIIETKKGRSEKPEISVNSSIGFQQVQKTIKMMTPYEFVKLQLEVSETNKRFYTPAELPEDNELYDPNGFTLDSYKGIKGFNWQDEVFRTAPIHIHNIAVRGRNNKTNYSLSGSFFNQEGILLKTGAKRYQARLNLTQQLTDRLNIRLNLNYSENIRQGTPISEGDGRNYITTLLYRTWGARPVAEQNRIDLIEMEIDPDNILNNPNDFRINPLVTASNEHSIYKVNTLSSSLGINYSITKNIYISSLSSMYKLGTRFENFYNSKTIQGSPLNRFSTLGIYGSLNFRDMVNFTNENTLNYSLRLKDHLFRYVVGNTIQNVKNDNYGFSSQQVFDETLGIYGMDQGSPYTNNISGNRSGLLSFFGRVNYSYKSRYLATISLRADGSSKFKKGNRWGYFPAFSFAWNMKEEPFMKNVAFLDESKLRLSYGITGNNRITDYSYYSRMALSIRGGYSWSNQTPIYGTIPGSIANPHLKWEATEQMNIGYDVGILKNRINATIDLYKKTTKDLLLYSEIPNYTGFGNVYKNIGSISNRGLEVTINTVNVKTKAFEWNTNFNISFNRNRIERLAEDQDNFIRKLYIYGQTSPLYVSKIGYAAGMMYGYVFDGIYQLEDFDNPSPDNYVLKASIPDNGTEKRELIRPGDIKFKDLNDDGKINSYDRTVIGNGVPLHIGGFTNNFIYKNISLNVFFQWSYGNDIFNANRLYFEGGSATYATNQYATYNDRWTFENQSNTHYRIRGGGPPGALSSKVVEDGSYLRLKTVSLAYSIPRRIINKAGINDITLRVSGQNLITWTKYSGLDPEVSLKHPILEPGYDFSPYPQARTITFGLNLLF